MSLLRSAIDRMDGIARTGFPKPPTVQPQVQHAFALLGSEVEAAEDPEELLPFLRTCKERPIAELRRGDLNRVLRGAWCDEEFDELAVAALERALEDKRSSSTRALIDGYLLYFPTERKVIQTLASAARQLGEEHSDSWRERSTRFQLFNAEQVAARLASGMAQQEEGAFEETCSQAGLGATPFATRLGQLAFEIACFDISQKSGRNAAQAQSNLLRLLEREDQFDNAPGIVRALLEPWIDASPEPAHRKEITDFLLDRVADPRLYPQKQKWGPIRDHLVDQVGAEQADEIIGVLRRWLTDAAMRTFFRAIAQTTDRPDQWKQRQEFWLAYLDEGVVTEAWPALGPRAKGRIREIAREQGDRLDHGTTQSGPTSSSSLLLQIGDLTISEWSDNGYCRFWSSGNQRAPKLYRQKYDNAVLRTMHGASDFAYIGHDAAGRWRSKIAWLVHQRTGVSHPKFGRGHR